MCFKKHLPLFPQHVRSYFWLQILYPLRSLLFFNSCVLLFWIWGVNWPQQRIHSIPNLCNMIKIHNISYIPKKYLFSVHYSPTISLVFFLGIITKPVFMYNLEQNGITLQDFGFLHQFSSGFTAMTISYQRQTCSWKIW